MLNELKFIEKHFNGQIKIQIRRPTRTDLNVIVKKLAESFVQRKILLPIQKS